MNRKVSFTGNGTEKDFSKKENLTSSSLPKDIDKTPKSDIIFKILFGNPKKPALLIDLLNSIIKADAPITHVSIEKTELTPEFLGKRGVRLDILAQTSDNRIINIEIQKHDEHNMISRSMFHWSKLFSGQAVVSEKYEDLKRTVCINILNFSMMDDKRFWHKYFVKDEETNEKLTDLLELHFFELPKIKKMPSEGSIMFWLEFINDPESKKIAGRYQEKKVYAEAREAYYRAIADPEVQELLRIRDKAEKDYLDAIARAADKATKKAEEKAKKREKQLVEKAEKEKKQLEEKAKAEKIESAKTALSMGLSVDQVSKITGLSLDEVKKL